VSDENQAEPKHVCFACVGDSYLSNDIKKNGKSKLCSYCGKKRRGITIDDLADHVEGAFERHYMRTSPYPDDYEFMMMRDRESDYEFERHGEEVNWAIANAVEVDEAIATDVQKNPGGATRGLRDGQDGRRV